MTSLEKISATLKLIDWKKNNLRKAIPLMTLEWKDFEEYLDSTQQSLEDCFSELESRENNLDLIRKSLTESNEELESVRKSIEGRLKELECKEGKFNLFQKEHIRIFKLRERQLDSFRELWEERVKEGDLRQEKLDAYQKSIEGLLKKFELKQKQFEAIRMSVGERFKEINLKKELFESRSKELDSIQNWIERRATELDTKEEHLEDRSKELDLKEKQLDSIQESTVERCKELQLKEKQLNSAQELNEERFKELELKESQLEDRSKELELKEKQFPDSLQSRVKIEPPDYVPADNAISYSSADIQFFITMDGKSLQSFLNERSKEHDSMADEVSKALRLSLDPAKLVLDAMEGFYPPHLKKGNLEFEGTVVRRSCILLLEQLMIISPEIRPHVKEAALKVAGEWKEKLIAGAGYSVEVLGFLQLVACYGLVPAFDAEEIINLFEIVAQHKKSPELCRALGLTDKISALKEKVKIGYTSSKAELEQQGEKKCNGASASAPKPQVQQQSVKRRRIVVTDDSRNTSVGAASSIHSIHSPHWQPAGLFADEYPGPPVGHYMSSYPDRPNHFYLRDALREGTSSKTFYPRDTLRESFYHDGRVLFPDPMDTLRGPGYYDGPPPFGGYDLPPPFRLPFNPQ